TGEAGPALLEWISGAGGAASGGPRGLRVVDIGPAVLEAGAPPLRSVLPPLSRYAKHLAGDRSVVAASVEASRGCNHRCRHCPVATVYKGRSRAVPLASIMDDVAQVVEAGAGHISFADPDFLNRPRHALEVAGALHGAFPELTFDATVKVEHVLRHHDIWEELRVAGLSHLVSAFESTDDRVLDILEKGHRALEEREAVRVLRGAGIEVHPSWLPFSPWTTLDSLAGLLELTAEADLVWNTDPVQFSIRLLLPRGSLLLEHPDPVLERALDGADSATGSWNWRHRDPAIDALQAEIAGLVEEYERDEDGSPSDPVRCFKEIWSLTRSAGAPLAGESPPEPDPALASPIAGPGRPRLSETWFCCAEPTVAQLDLLRHR
ncbi:MAG: radical SAM protein, partial [Acidimicrobiales bacterium]